MNSISLCESNLDTTTCRNQKKKKKVQRLVGVGPYVSRKRVPDTVTKALNNFFDIEEMNQTMIEKLGLYLYTPSLR